MSFWRNAIAGGLDRQEQRLAYAMQTLKKHRDGKCRWGRFPFYYTISALIELDMPQALAVLFEVIGSDKFTSNKDRALTILDFDKVLGLGLSAIKDFDKDSLPSDIKDLYNSRLKAREEKNFEESDRLRDEIEKLGYVVEDTKEGMRVFKK